MQWAEHFTTLVVTRINLRGDNIWIWLYCSELICNATEYKVRRKRGKPKITWAEGIKGLMGEKGLMKEDWNDRSN
jgi:hypothetical protein